MKINEMIRTRRKEMNLTQEQVASRLGVSAPAVHKWETGNSYPDITLLPALARLLGTDLNTLLSFQEDLSRQEVDQFCADLCQMIEAKGSRPALRLLWIGLPSIPTAMPWLTLLLPRWKAAYIYCLLKMPGTIPETHRSTLRTGFSR